MLFVVSRSSSEAEYHAMTHTIAQNYLAMLATLGLRLRCLLPHSSPLWQHKWCSYRRKCCTSWMHQTHLSWLSPCSASQSTRHHISPLCSSNPSQIADFFTKSHTVDHFHQFLSELSLHFLHRDFITLERLDLVRVEESLCSQEKQFSKLTILRSIKVLTNLSSMGTLVDDR